jgi:phosphate starvation-inducible PhoH-like protein
MFERKKKVNSNANKAKEVIKYKFETWKKTIIPKSLGQKSYFEALNNYELVFGLGPAGTGKSYLAVAKGIDMLKKGLG